MLSSEPGDGSGNGNKAPLIIVLASLLVVGLLAGGSYFLFFRDSEDDSASAASTSAAEDPEAEETPTEPAEKPTPDVPTPDVPTPDEPTPDEPTKAVPPPKEEQPPPDEDDPPAPNPDPGAGPSLSYEPMGNGWEPTQVTLFPLANGERVVTEPDYAEGSDWQALIATGKARPEWVAPGDPKTTAKHAADWFATDGFGAAEVTPETTDEGPLKIDGYDAYVLEQHYSFSLPDLEAEGETVHLIAVDFGDTAGIFVASIPDTHPDLVADAERARDSLSVTE